MKRANENDKDICYVYAYDSEGDFVLIKDYDDISVKPLVGYKFNHEMENKPTVTTTDIINHAKVFYEKNDAEKLIKWLKNNWVILNDEMVDYDDLKVGYKDNYNNIYDILTDKVVYINDDGDEIGESMKLSEAKQILKESGYQLIDEVTSEGRYCIMNKNDNTYFTGMGATDKCFPWTDDIEKAYRRFGNESYAKYSAMETIDYIVWHDGKRLGIDTSDLVVLDTKTGETFEYTEEKPKGFFRFD